MKKTIIIMFAVIFVLSVFVSCDEGMSDLVGFEVSFDANGGTGDMVSLWVNGSRTIAPASTFEKDGYSFLSWNTKADGSGTTYAVGDSISGSQTTGIKLYAQWTADEFDITVAEVEHGAAAVLASQYVIKDDDVYIPLAATPDAGYELISYTVTNADVDSENKFLIIPAGTTGDITVTPNFSAIVYGVTLYRNGGTVVSGDVASYTYGVGATLPTDIERDGFIFCGWYDNSNFDGSAVATISVSDTGDKTFFAKWATDEFDIVVTEVENGSAFALAAEYSIKDGDTYISLVATPAKGYELSHYEVINAGVDNESKYLMIPAGTTGEITVTPVFSAITYGINVRSTVRGTSTADESSYTIGVEDKIVNLSATPATGYALFDWKLEAPATVTITDNIMTIPAGTVGDITVTPDFLPRYVITLEKNGGTINSGNVEYYFFSEMVSLPSDISKIGNTFRGWYDNSLFAGDQVETLSNTTFGDKTFYAKWEKNTYTIKFNANGGTGTMTDQSFEYGSADYIKENAFTRIGYTLSGWNTVATPTEDAPGTSYSNQSALAEIAEDLTLYAQWTVNSYTVTLNTNGGTISEDDNITSYTYGVGATLPTATSVSRTGYTFSGWFSNSELTGDEISAISTTDTGNKIFYAKWTANSYGVSLNTNGGEIAAGKQVSSYTYGVGATLPDSEFISRTGYTFSGWYTNSEFTGDAVTSVSATDTGAKTFYAKWAANTYNVTFNANGGIGLMTDQSFTYGEAAKALSSNAFTKIGYSFAGWNTAADGSGTSYSDGEIVSNLIANLILYAQWNAVTYNISFNANGGTGLMTDQSFTYGEAAKALTSNAFTKVGYSFAGWNTAADGTGTSYSNGQSVANFTEDQTFYAQWDIIYYTVTITGATSQSSPSYTYTTEPSGTVITFTTSSPIEEYSLTSPASAVVAFDQINSKVVILSESYGNILIELVF